MSNITRQRASAGGLIITEATDISTPARGYPGAPGIYSAEQIEGWRLVTDAVHAKGGIIFLQIWHTGRVTHSSMQPGGGRRGAVGRSRRRDAHGCTWFIGSLRNPARA